jgi:dihydrofolate reductase
MARLVYSAITSLDGYVADEDGNFDWGEPDHEVHAAVNDLMRTVGTQLYGRRLYEVMLAWETMDTTAESAVTKDFAIIWRDTEKVVYSTELETVDSERTRIERSFDPASVQVMKADAARDLLVGGADLAGQALKAGLVDDLHLFVSPVLVGGGTHALPRHLRLGLSLVDERRFGNGVVHLHYRTAG